MSLVKGKQESKTILDVSRRQKVSKTFIRNALRQADVLELMKVDTGLYMVDNEIRVGMYTIKLVFEDLDSSRPRHKLREYGGFSVNIFENSPRDSSSKMIPVALDKRFQGQYWLPRYLKYKLRMNALVDIVMHCVRLDRMRAFN